MWDSILKIEQPKKISVHVVQFMNTLKKHTFNPNDKIKYRTKWCKIKDREKIVRFLLIRKRQPTTKVETKNSMFQWSSVRKVKACFFKIYIRIHACLCASLSSERRLVQYVYVYICLCMTIQPELSVRVQLCFKNAYILCGLCEWGEDEKETKSQTVVIHEINEQRINWCSVWHLL